MIVLLVHLSISLPWAACALSAYDAPGYDLLYILTILFSLTREKVGSFASNYSVLASRLGPSDHV